MKFHFHHAVHLTLEQRTNLKLETWNFKLLKYERPDYRR